MIITGKSAKCGILVYLCLFIIGIMVIPMLASCAKEGVSGTTNANARLKIVNLSPDVQPFNLYTRYIRQNTTNYSYPSASDYFLLNTADIPFQIRTAQLSTNTPIVNLLTIDSVLKPKVPYTLFVTGLLGNSSLTYVITPDTGSVPANGRGKIRFINVAPANLSLNLTANGTSAFTKVAYKAITGYIELTAGSYNLNISAANNPAVAIASLPNFTVLDGKLYTVYAYGLSNRTDTAAFEAGAVLNTLPPGTTY